MDFFLLRIVYKLFLDHKSFFSTLANIVGGRGVWTKSVENSTISFLKPRTLKPHGVSMTIWWGPDSQYLIAKCHGCVNLCDSGFISEDSDNPVLPGS